MQSHHQLSFPLFCISDLCELHSTAYQHSTLEKSIKSSDHTLRQQSSYIHYRIMLTASRSSQTDRTSLKSQQSNGIFSACYITSERKVLQSSQTAAENTTTASSFRLTHTVFIYTFQPFDHFSIRWVDQHQMIFIIITKNICIIIIIIIKWSPADILNPFSHSDILINNNLEHLSMWNAKQSSGSSLSNQRICFSKKK